MEPSPCGATDSHEEAGEDHGSRHHPYIGLEMTDSLWLRATRVRHGYGALKVCQMLPACNPTRCERLDGLRQV